VTVAPLGDDDQNQPLGVHQDGGTEKDCPASAARGGCEWRWGSSAKWTPPRGRPTRADIRFRNRDRRQGTAARGTRSESKECRSPSTAGTSPGTSDPANRMRLGGFPLRPAPVHDQTRYRWNSFRCSARAALLTGHRGGRAAIARARERRRSGPGAGLLKAHVGFDETAPDSTAGGGRGVLGTERGSWER